MARINLITTLFPADNAVSRFIFIIRRLVYKKVKNDKNGWLTGDIRKGDFGEDMSPILRVI
jgi:hypothetical protein